MLTQAGRKIHTAIDSRLVISDLKNGLRTSTEALASIVETSQRHTISDIDKSTDRICEEMHTWGVLQTQKADKLSADVQVLKERGFYKGFVLYSSYIMNLPINCHFIADSRRPSRGCLFERAP